jgi:MraZ protein
VALFLSTVTNRVDKKGRVSVPAAFRAAVQPQGFNGIVLYPAQKWPCIEGCDMARMEQVSDSLDQLDALSEERDFLATTLFGEAHTIQFDPDGRIILPRELAEHAGIEDEASFVGLGKTFQVWNPQRLAAFKAQARDHAAKASGLIVKGSGGGT